MKNIYILDTNILLHNPQSIHQFTNAYLVLPIIVLDEINEIKKENTERGANARIAESILKEIRKLDVLSEWVAIGNDSYLKVEMNKMSSEISMGLNDVHDNIMLSVATNLMKEEKSVTLVSKKFSLRTKAESLGIKCEDYCTDMIKELYTGQAELFLPSETITEFYNNKYLQYKEDDLLNNQYVVLKSENQSQSALGRYFDGKILPLVYNGGEIFTVTALNKEQRFAFDMLLNPNIRIVSLSGVAGTGKTVLAIAAGLHLMETKKKFKRMLITRPTIGPKDTAIGHLPGNKADKLKPQMAPIYDNCDFIFQGSNGYDLDGFIEKGKIELEALTFIRGRSLSRSFIIFDESQNTNQLTMKTMLTRVSQGSKIVITGDPDQIDNPYLSKETNGLVHLIDELKGEKIFGHMSLIKCERDEVADLAARKL